MLRSRELRFLGLIFALVVSTVQPWQQSAARASEVSEPPGPFQAKVAPWVIDQTAAGREAEFLVLLAGQADLHGASLLQSKGERGRFVRDALLGKARETQRPLLAWLAARGSEYRAFYIVNLVWVKGDRELVQALTARSDVARILGNPYIRNKLPDAAGIPGASPRLPAGGQGETWPSPPAFLSDGGPNHTGSTAAVESSLLYVHAPDVWAAGFRGEGIVVGGQDTGYDWNHPALIAQYRGWDGSTANHDYNWHDSIHSGGGICGSDSPEPCDDYDHGTHTMGTAVGSDGSANQIGMAPGAKWIGCRNMDQGIGSPARYLECFEFFLAPYPVGATPDQGDPSKAPDVTVNSWGCPNWEGCSPDVLRAAVDAQRAAGILTVVSAGNEGPGCFTVVDPPAIYPSAYSVGALITGSDNIAGFSSRGPVAVGGSLLRKPDISAPGTNIRSSVPGGGYASAGWNGTSMAAPHVAGAVALLWSARPFLKNQAAVTGHVLSEAAAHIPSMDCGSSAWPNNTFGYGRLDVKEALDRVPADAGILSGTITDAAMSGIPRVAVEAAGESLQSGHAISEESGFYALVLPGGIYTISTSAIGYGAFISTSIEIESYQTTTLNIQLEAQRDYLPLITHDRVP